MTLRRALIMVWLWIACACDRRPVPEEEEHARHGGRARELPPPTPGQEPQQTPTEDHRGHSAPAPSAPDGDADGDQLMPPQGFATVLLDPARRQALGVRVAPVAYRSFEREVRASGIVRVDETKQAHVHLKFEGFVEKVFVNYVGRRVKKGERLLSIYSPELLAAEAEYVQALDARDQVKAGEFAALERAQAEALMEAARSRLLLLDIPRAELARLARTRQASRTLIIRSPLSGTVLERNVVDGMRVMPEMALLVIADLSQVWVLADVFESDLSAIRVGHPASIRFAGGAAPDRGGTVAFISPTLNEVTRTAQVRIEVPNPEGSVRPGLFADVVFRVAGGRRLSVPAAAVIETGIRKVAFVETAPGRFQPRELRVGSRARGFVEVLSGLSEGERVAVSAQFLLDAESQIRGSAAPGAHGGH